MSSPFTRPDTETEGTWERAMADPPREPPGRRGRKFLLNILALIFVAAIITVVSWIWVKVGQRFPYLPEGSYAGTIGGVFDAQSQRYPLVVESLPSSELVFIIGKPGFQPVRVTAVPVSRSETDVEWLHPVMIHADNELLKLHGIDLSHSRFSGKVTNRKNDQGSWELVRVEKGTSSVGLESSELELQVRLRDELGEIEDQLFGMKKGLRKRSGDVEQLHTFITNEADFRSKAAVKLEELRSERKGLQTEIVSLRAEAKRLEDKVKLSQRVTPAGKLVALAREAFDRENRWLESMLRSGVASKDPRVSKALKHGEEILEWRRKMSVEKERLYRLNVVKERRRGLEQSLDDSLEDFWRE